MPNNAFMGQVFFADGASEPAWLTYDDANSCWIASIGGVTPIGFEEVYSHQSDFDISESEAGSHNDPNMNKVVDMAKSTGKLTITMDASIYGALVKNYQGNPVNVVLVSRANGQGAYVHQIVPFFTKKTIAGKMQISEMTFEFQEPANSPATDKRHRLFEIVAPH